MPISAPSWQQQRRRAKSCTWPMVKSILQHGERGRGEACFVDVGLVKHFVGCAPHCTGAAWPETNPPVGVTSSSKAVEQLAAPVVSMEQAGQHQPLLVHRQAGELGARGQVLLKSRQWDDHNVRHARVAVGVTGWCIRPAHNRSTLGLLVSCKLIACQRGAPPTHHWEQHQRAPQCGIRLVAAADSLC